MEKKSKKKSLPVWWVKVIGDLERAVAAATLSFEKPGTVLGFDDDYMLVRREDRSIGKYFIEDTKAPAPRIGSKVRFPIPEPDEIDSEIELKTFVFNVIANRVHLIPRVWLRKIIKKMVNNEPVTKDDLRPFPIWVLLPLEKREDKALIDLLYRATRYEGLKGLARFNDMHVD